MGWGAFAPYGTFPVVFRANAPSVEFSLSREKDSPAFAQCSGECVVPLASGKYWLSVRESEVVVGGRRRIEVKEPSELSIEPRTHDDRRSGQVMGYIGIGLAVAGIAAMVATLSDATGESKSKDGASAGFALGFGAFIGGAILTPLGWVRAGRSAPQVKATPIGGR